MALCTPRRLVGVLGVVLLWHALSIALSSLPVLSRLPVTSQLSCRAASASLHTPGTINNVTYALVDSNSVLPKPQHILATDDLPFSCLDALYTSGAPCASSSSRDVHFDVVWTYVNGSDPLHQSTYNSRFKEYHSGPRINVHAQGTPKFFRDHDELRHSMRSVLHHFREHVSQFHVLLADFPVPDNSNITEGCGTPSNRLGQIPQWLDIESQNLLDHTVSLDLHHHSEFFTHYESTVFNSFAIESQMSNVANLQEHFLYMNDDYFLTADLHPSDFYTQEYGIVLLLQSDAVVIPESWSKTKARGEWFALEHSNEILGRRFGYRPRPYLAHQTKSGSRALMQELRAVFPDELRSAGDAVFRAEPHVGGVNAERDVHTLWLFANFVIERAREAMLWSWVVARVGSDNDEWDSEVQREVRSLGWMDDEAGEIVVTPGLRTTLTSDQLNLHLGARALSKRTTYTFASADGYPVSVLIDKDGVPHWPNLTTADSASSGRLSCRIGLDRCFPRGLTRASEVFKHIAFKELSCGDCIITALVAKSGDLGLHAFLPSPDRGIPTPSDRPSGNPPHLPLCTDWWKCDYTLRSVVSKSYSLATLREWTERLIHRYQWVMGSTPSHFQSISSPNQARSTLAKLRADVRAGKVAMVCINDNIALRPTQTSEAFRKWQEAMWGEPMVWEKQGA